MEGAPGALDAAARARSLREGFLQAFLLGLGVAAAAALGAVGLAWQASRVARERSEFAAAAAHELRTPLTSLRLHAHLIAEDSEVGSRARGQARPGGSPARRSAWDGWSPTSSR